MELAFVWMPLLLLLVSLLTVGVAVLLRWLLRRRAGGDAVPIAHRERLTALPGYRRALRRYRVLLAASLGVTLLALLAGGLAASRPVESTVRNTDLVNRDIVLCLDISGSMVAADSEVMARFRELAEGFRGERIALVLWNSSSVQIFPLTDDYGFIDEYLGRVRDSMTLRIGENSVEDEYLYWAGTYSGDGASLVGDGLASCVLGFDRKEEEGRSRSIILATDNYLNGNPIMTLAEASDFARDRGVRVYAIDPQDYGETEESAELRREAEATGGGYFALKDPSAVGNVVQRVLSEQASHLSGTPELVVDDVPVLPMVIAALALWGVIGLGWWLRT